MVLSGGTCIDFAVKDAGGCVGALVWLLGTPWQNDLAYNYKGGRSCHRLGNVFSHLCVAETRNQGKWPGVAVVG